MIARDKIEDAIKTWRQLAADELRRIELGIACDPDAARYRADGYMRTVQALEIQLVTGVAVCSCHLRPFNEVLS